jgi:FlaA1/EpsC-like NDP-sugar epimerase
LISTDKAVHPTSVMGATKRLAEIVLQAMHGRNLRTRFSMVRFGNVLASSGSVVPLFEEQIKAGGPVTVTHPEVRRYFMTIPEAASLVLQAGSMAKGGEVFLLDMGQPVRIDELARRMIALSGLTVRDASNPDGDIEVQYTGLRPAEKLLEEPAHRRQSHRHRAPNDHAGHGARASLGRSQEPAGRTGDGTGKFRLRSRAPAADDRRA